ncbi:MAG: PucR family transcriptional regulator [Bifidobacterium sp.]|nr:PucR family transcriptional regulator [Bifidobacterium sp.]
MTVTMDQVLERSAMRLTDPEVVAGAAGLGNAVRWVVTNERYDAARFLSGGELVLVEGSALLAHLDDTELVRYVDSLADIGAAGLAIELVEGVRTVPRALRVWAERRALPVIGLRRRIPFVELCQSIDTLIVTDQLTVHMDVDELSTVLRHEMPEGAAVADLAGVLAEVFGESVAIYDAHARLVGEAGPAFLPEEVGAPTSRVPVDVGGLPTLVVELSQRVRVFDPVSVTNLSAALERIVKHLADAPAVTLRDTTATMEAQGSDGRAAAILDMLVSQVPLVAGDTYVPLVVRMRSLNEAMGPVRSVLDAMGTAYGAPLGIVLEEDTLYLLVRVPIDARGDLARLNMMLAPLETGKPCAVLRGHPETDRTLLATQLTVMRRTPAKWGSIRTVGDVLGTYCLGEGCLGEPAAVFTGVMLGSVLLRDGTLLRTLAACFDTAHNKTQACSSLGIQRQTLYNRLDRVHMLTGIDPNGSPVWPQLALAARMALILRR